MIHDAQSNPLAGATPAARDLFDAGCEAFATYSGDPVSLFDAAAAEAPDCLMIHLARAWCFTLATEPEAAAAARASLAEVAHLAADDRTAGHLAGLQAALAGNWTEAARAMEHHSLRFPRDLIALQAGHLLDFLRADARTLRDRIARALPHWDRVPGHSLVLGMHAFGLEETGAYARAEEIGRAAVEANPSDCWAHHAVAHVMEMEGRAADGLAWITSREAHWAQESNFLKVHNWWHRALCHIELGEPQAALALYDGPIQQGGAAMDLVDASALLWRLDLMGVDVGDRFGALSTRWEALSDGQLYPFNDLHAAMSHLGAGREAEVERLLARMASANGSETADWVLRTGRPLIEGFRAFRRGDHASAAERLWSARHIVNVFGGSHAQRDVIDWTLTEAALRGGLSDMADALVAERRALRPHSPVNLAFRDRLCIKRIAA
ncbi:tetratricopeptide repeat protein [Roseibacterium sp. SDUM158017]|uniref:tetratricopeptide repeat protein n=1 Tax=Roseicyclus salinarum TaxID=3036773 RepID=UPI0024157413|nr:tetratricopeptide repeat protein [Roseibacterium sp. SDUM158017]MDG4650385.1 tetratricopeptide repeat protein [Roseibacterium sp. SDUM158017]